MDTIYRKLYATLVGHVDRTVEYMEECMVNGKCGWENWNQAAKNLRNALLEVEDMYLDAEDG